MISGIQRWNMNYTIEFYACASVIYEFYFFAYYLSVNIYLYFWISMWTTSMLCNCKWSVFGFDYIGYVFCVLRLYFRSMTRRARYSTLLMAMIQASQAGWGTSAVPDTVGNRTWQSFSTGNVQTFDIFLMMSFCLVWLRLIIWQMLLSNVTYNKAK